MALRVELAPRAAEDLEEIAAFIARDDVVAALRWVDQLEERARRVGRQPRSGRVVPEYGVPDVREVFLGNYRIVYRIEAKRVVVLRFLEGHRRLR